MCVHLLCRAYFGKAVYIATSSQNISESIRKRSAYSESLPDSRKLKKTFAEKRTTEALRFPDKKEYVDLLMYENQDPSSPYFTKFLTTTV